MRVCQNRDFGGEGGGLNAKYKHVFLKRRMLKQLRFCHKLRFSNSISLQINVVDPGYFKLNMNSSGSNSLSFKYQRFTPSGCKDTKIKKLELLTCDQFLSNLNLLEKIYIECMCRVQAELGRV